MSKQKTVAIKHDRFVIKAGYIAVAVNLTLAVFKIIVGLFSNSIAIISDAIHGLIDTLSGIIIIVSEKLGSNPKIKKSHAEIEHTGAVLIAIIILIVGADILKESIEKIFHPEENIEYSIPIIIILAVSIISKLVLGFYLKTTGKKLDSDTLTASSVETLNDSFISGAVLASITIYLIWNINIEAYISTIISIIIIKLGLELIFPRLFKHHHSHSI